MSALSVRVRQFWQRSLRFFRLTWLRLIRQRMSAHGIALGMAIGTFWSMIPIPGLQGVFAVGMAFLTRSSKIAAWIGTWISNYFTAIPHLIACYEIGKFVLGSDVAFTTDLLEWDAFWSYINTKGWELVWVMQVGGVALGAVSAVPAYFITLRAVLGYRRRRAHRIMRRLHELQQESQTGGF